MTRSRGRSRRAAGERFHRQGADRRSAAGTGHLLSRPVSGSLVSDHRRRAAGRPFPHRAGRSPLDFFSGRATPRARLGHRRGARRHAHLCDHAASHARISSSIRGDSIYADCPIPSQQTLPDGDVWSNIVTEDKSRVAQTLADFRGNYKYNLLDQICGDSMRRCRCSRNGTTTKSPTTGGRASRVAERICRKQRAAARRARPPRLSRIHADAGDMAEAGRIYRKIAYGPLLDVFLIDMRSYRGPNGDGDKAPVASICWPEPDRWLKRELVSSHATWKVIAADLPIGLVSEDAVAQGDGPPRGRETRSPTCFIKHAGVSNTVWMTADMHYTAAHHYDPNRAVFQDFDPFWEFVSGPLHAGTWGPAPLDNTFGPRVISRKAAAGSRARISRPASGCNSSAMSIDGADRGDDGDAQGRRRPDLWSTEIAPATARPAAHRRSRRGRLSGREHNCHFGRIEQHRTSTSSMGFVPCADFSLRPPQAVDLVGRHRRPPRPSIRSTAPSSWSGARFDFKVEFPDAGRSDGDQRHLERRRLMRRCLERRRSSSNGRTARICRP